MTNTSKQAKADGQPNCPHCGGIHFGQKFDDWIDAVGAGQLMDNALLRSKATK